VKAIIAGGRKYRFTAEDTAKLDSARAWISEVVSGGASGADTCGEQWARANGIPVTRFPADWDNLGAPGAEIRYTYAGKPYNANAGKDRNKQMAEYARGGVCGSRRNGNRTHARRSRSHRPSNLGLTQAMKRVRQLAETLPGTRPRNAVRLARVAIELKTNEISS